MGAREMGVIVYITMQEEERTSQSIVKAEVALKKQGAATKKSQGGHKFWGYINRGELNRTEEPEGREEKRKSRP